ncbi:MAG TPA: glycosyltransferase family 39 protein [Anaerolineae bacterium]
MPRPSPATRHRAALVLILLAGMALRCWRLGSASLWYDETVSVYLAGSPVSELLRHTAGDIHPPGYYLLLRAWLILTGYPTGHADPHGQGLEFSSAFLSLAIGMLLVALGYVLARRLAGSLLGDDFGRRSGLLSAALLAFSPYNVWYGQEVRMYTLGACLGVTVILALWEATSRSGDAVRWRWWLMYALAAAAGLYTLYYFAFLLAAVNVWAIARLAGAIREPVPPRKGDAAPATARRPRPFIPYLLANLTALILYAPWFPVAWRQATQPPVPPWRVAAALGPAIRETWTALVAGQSAPGWLWPAVLLFLPVYVLGLAALLRARTPADESAGFGLPTTLACMVSSPAALLALATFGAFFLVMLVSAVTPLYHVRYIFTYSPAFYVVVAAGMVALGRRLPAAGAIVAAFWLAAAAPTLYAFWYDPHYQTDDHRAAVAYLESHWRPGDVLLVNAGYAYTALATYWQPALPQAAATGGAAVWPADTSAWRGRLTGPLPTPRSDDVPLVITTGHVDGSEKLGWGDPRSDFFALPASTARSQIGALFERFNRVWQYRIYDTVNDPQGVVRQALARGGTLIDDQVFAGEAFTRVQAYVPRQGVSAPPAAMATGVSGALQAAAAPGTWQTASNAIIYPRVMWRADDNLGRVYGTSLRLAQANGKVWAQPPDEQPLGPLYRSDLWLGGWQAQTFALPIPAGTPPGRYTLSLVVYDMGSRGVVVFQGALASPPGGVSSPSLTLGTVEVQRPAPEPPPQPAVARFGPLALLSATSPATELSPGDRLPVDLLWQAAASPGEPLVIVLQLLDIRGNVAAGLEAQPVDGSYPTQLWEKNEIVRDRHSLALPKDLAPGVYRLIAGVYRAGSGQRLETAQGLFGRSDHFDIKKIAIRP